MPPPVRPRRYRADVHALPAILALAAALALAPGLLAAMRRAELVRPNYRGRPLPCPFGVLIVAAALLAAIPVELLHELAGSATVYPELGAVTLYAIGVAFLGLVDDAAPAAVRGWRGHGRALLRGELSSGALKALGALALALLVLAGRGYGAGRYLLAVALLVLTTNAFNLLDLRPGRCVKAFVALGVALTIAAGSTRTLATLGPFVAPVLVAGAYDLRERAMLGDTGANLVGALAGLWLVFALGTTAQIVALAVVLALTVYAELRSLSTLIERTPLLRQLDSWGRPRHA